MLEKPNDELKAYRLGKLTVLQLMSLLAVLGVVGSVLLQHWFGV